MPTWPTALPQRPLARAHGEQPQNNVLRTQMEVGPPKLRRRSTAAITLLPVQYLLKDTEVATFLTFYHTTVKDGSLAFDWPHPRTGATVSVRFKGEPQIDHVEYKNYVVKFTLEQLP